MSSKTQSKTASLEDINYGKLMNVARSANKQFDLLINTDAPKKPALVDEMADANIVRTADGWELDGEEIDLLESQYQGGSNGGSTGPSDKTVLYCLTRAETTEERVDEISDALETAGYELRQTASGDKYAIVLPVESQEVPEDDEDDEDDEEENPEVEPPEEDELDEAEEAEESESDESQKELKAMDEAEEESADEAEEAAEGEDDDEDEEELLSREVVRERFENKNMTELKENARERDISGRSTMTKDELIEALLDDMDEVADE